LELQASGSISAGEAALLPRLLRALQARERRGLEAAQRRLLARPVWEPRSAPEASIAPAPWAVVGGDALAAALRSQGADAACVAPGALGGVAAGTRVVVSTDADAADPGSAEHARGLVAAALPLLQEAARVGAEVWWITRGAAAVRAGESPSPAQAA